MNPEELNELRRQVEQEQQRRNQEAPGTGVWPAPGNHGIEDDLNIKPKHMEILGWTQELASLQLDTFGHKQCFFFFFPGGFCPA